MFRDPVLQSVLHHIPLLRSEKIAQLPDHRLRPCRAVDVTPDDLLDVIFLPGEDFGDDALRQVGGVESRRGGASQIVKMQIAISEAGLRLRENEAASKAQTPRPAEAIRQDGGRALWDAREHIAQRVIERNYCLAAMLALAGGDLDRVIADMRPAQPKQIALAKAGMDG